MVRSQQLFLIALTSTVRTIFDGKPKKPFWHISDFVLPSYTRSVRKVSCLHLYLRAIVFERPLRGMNVNSKALRTYWLLVDIFRTYSSCDSMTKRRLKIMRRAYSRPSLKVSSRTVSTSRNIAGTMLFNQVGITLKDATRPIMKNNASAEI